MSTMYFKIANQRLLSFYKIRIKEFKYQSMVWTVITFPDLSVHIADRYHFLRLSKYHKTTQL